MPRNADQQLCGALLLPSPQVFGLETLANHSAAEGRFPDPLLF